jgi:hypothetical protein
MGFMCDTPAGTFGAVMGMGLRSSGITASGIGALRRGLRPCLMRGLTRRV